MATSPMRERLGERVAAGRLALVARARAGVARVDARAGLRAGVGLVWLLLAPGLVAFWRGDLAAAEAAVRVAVGFSLLAWLGRGLRGLVERNGGRASFAVWREPVWDGVVGWLVATAGLLGFSLVWKRVLGQAAAVGPLWPVATVALAAGLALSRGAGPAAAPSRRWFGRLGGALAAFAFLAAGHLGARKPYSSDPEQHIAWLTQLQLHGFVPDVYWQTDVPITYPLGFAALAHALGGLSGVAAPVLVAALPVLTSFLVVFLVLAATAALVSGGEGRRAPWRFGLALLAGASVFESAQFSAWNVYEGTGRLAAGPLHVVPLLVILSAAVGASRLRRSGAAADRPGALLGFACPTTLALVALLNPSHLLLQGVLWGTAFAAVALRGRVRLDAGRVFLGLLAGAGAALALLAADGVTARRGLGLGEVDPALARVEAEFDGGFAGATCWTPGCVASVGLEPGVWAAAAIPARVLVEGPWRALVEPAWDRFRVPLVRGARAFPDLTGTGLAPLHGAVARVLLVPVPLVLVWVGWRRRRSLGAWTAALLAIVAAASLDAMGRAAVAVWVDPDDAALRLLPSYAARGAAVLFAQAFWPLAVGGLVLMARAWPAVWCGGLSLLLALVAAQGELSERRAEVARWRPGPDRADIANLRELEALYVPPGEHYLVSSHIADSNGERWLIPLDPSSPLYAQAGRPALFHYHLSSGALVTGADLEESCRVLRPAVPAPLLAAHRARWVAFLARDEGTARLAFGARRFCGRPYGVVFPDARFVARRGRVALFALW